MPQWSDYSTGERIKILRGKHISQQQLANMTELSLPTIRAAEQGRRLSLPTLLKIANALSVDTSVVLGQQAPRRSMEPSDRTTLRFISSSVHDTAAGYLPADAEAVDVAELSAATKKAWSLYWSGNYQELGAILGPLLRDAAVTAQVLDGDAAHPVHGFLSDGYQIAACVANLFGARDLAYSSIGHSRNAALASGDALRTARVDSARSWVYLRDGRLQRSMAVAEEAATAIEPRYSDHSPERLTVYGNLLNHCAVTAARLEDEVRTGDFLSQLHAVGARLGRERDFHGARFGPHTATTQAVGINVTIGKPGKALQLIESVKPSHLDGLADAARNRYRLDVALAQADAKLYDKALDTLEDVLHDAPQWSRHQALPAVIVQKIGSASTARLRRVSKMIGVPAVPIDGFAPATAKTAL
ncbi:MULTISPECIES: helix-turn-helix domain-containing protein [Streptomyces]|uniref:helix-turn-helix domain-containing protein n=1 Tax=Streptomyces TaxID=1883 RepID=UPI00226FA48E|nr:MULTISPECIES: helix-turn-helix transcriptional regulator [unclassified Streptomyces]MCY0923289.1 helix-turn-helix transcriptional regulator [Streptomyces sp. H27-G5]MCY0943968.1 helix-turn-helix transcriptional regulator [Streptomyces sp. H34-AA3]MCY0956312.1 helix-turn-helix transcriptional regulator [Streptomyces sp. H27-H5]MCZ4082332.1 helix-turn-helix transcriptional regulator [Streptomyces sp. H34-S5]